MDKVRFVVLYGGEWSNSGGKIKYQYGILFSFKLHKSSSGLSNTFKNNDVMALALLLRTENQNFTNDRVQQNKIQESLEGQTLKPSLPLVLEHIVGTWNKRYELRKVEHVDDQSQVPEDIINLVNGFFFTLQFYYTTEFRYSHGPRRTLESDDKASQCHFHVQFDQLYAEDEDSLSGKLRDQFYHEDLPEDVQKTITNFIVDMSMSIACTTPNPEFKVEPILVQIGIVLVISMKEDSLFKSTLITIVINEGSLTGEQCVICLEEFSKGGEIVMIPCSHVCHRNCIVKWLEMALNCPVCRFALEKSD
ncbi:hypothetical protein EZV62_022252 [Acer yangbiense]|uniref:RING-type E3 ubiquitin transferase n=1 Tax=Acer yangbiense TaxID=1000413 RepID=A0A5C7H7P8_9ROSI|nr:hypothetical protein EZV62_022252 [Acer yangbiense]